MNIISFLNPTNLTAEKEKFFASTTYHPQFTYNWDETEIHTFIQKEPEYAEFARAVLSQDRLNIQTKGEKAFATKIDPILLSLAKQKTQIPPQRFVTPAIEKIVAAFKIAMQSLGIDYSIEVSDAHGFNFRPVHEERKIVLSRHLNMQYFSIDGEIKHELVHVIRNINTVHNKRPFSASYLPTEEGLATYFQDYVGEDGASSQFQHASEYLMTEQCLRNPLRQVIEWLQTIGFEKELAWQRAVRHTFGLQDTSIPGDNMKPSMYFYWQQKIAATSDAEKLRLLSGKVRLDELTDYPEYSGRIPKTQIQEFYQLKS